jgi:hypothetical protein
MTKRARKSQTACAVAVLTLGIACGDAQNESAQGPGVDPLAADAAGSSSESASASDAGATSSQDASADPSGDASGDASASDSASPSPHPPATVDASIEVELGDTMTGTLGATDPDGDALTFSIVTAPAKGTLTSFDPSTGAYTYAASGSTTGADSFTFQVTDGTSNAPSPGTIAVTITPVLFTGNYAVTSVKDNGASCTGSDFRLGHATAAGGNAAYFAISSRHFSCGNTSYDFDPARFSASGAASITDDALTFTQSKFVSGCGTVTEAFSLTRTATGDFDLSETIQVPCFGVGTHAIAGKATRSPAAYLFFEPSTAAFGRVARDAPAVSTVSLRNVGRLLASTLSVESPAAPFSFDGGAFPGTGGTCGSQVSPLSSCTMAIAFDTSALAASKSITIAASYLDGASTDSDSLAISGQVVPTLTAVTEIAAAANYQCAIDQGQVVCWGQNGTVPTPPNDLVNPRKLTAGSGHACVIDDSGVRCFGADNYGQSTPPALSNPISVSAGNSHTCALDATGVHCWGLNTSGQATVPALSTPTLVSAGSAHTCALDATGVHCWGLNGDGQTTVPALTNPTVVSAGGQYTCAIDATGLHCWGNNFANRATPPAIASPATVDAGGNLACALAGGGALSCWGFFSSGVPKFTGVSAVATGDQHVCVLIGSQVSCYSSSTLIYP